MENEVRTISLTFGGVMVILLAVIMFNILLGYYLEKLGYCFEKLVCWPGVFAALLNMTVYAYVFLLPTDKSLVLALGFGCSTFAMIWLGKWIAEAQVWFMTKYE